MWLDVENLSSFIVNIHFTPVHWSLDDRQMDPVAFADKPLPGMYHDLFDFYKKRERTAVDKTRFCHEREREREREYSRGLDHPALFFGCFLEMLPIACSNTVKLKSLNLLRNQTMSH
jgi:hypothetical protein